MGATPHYPGINMHTTVSRCQSHRDKGGASNLVRFEQGRMPPPQDRPAKQSLLLNGAEVTADLRVDSQTSAFRDVGKMHFPENANQ